MHVYQTKQKEHICCIFYEMKHTKTQDLHLKTA